VVLLVETGGEVEPLDVVPRFVRAVDSLSVVEEVVDASDFHSVFPD